MSQIEGCLSIPVAYVPAARFASILTRHEGRRRTSLGNGNGSPVRDAAINASVSAKRIEFRPDAWIALSAPIACSGGPAELAGQVRPLASDARIYFTGQVPGIAKR